MGDKPIEAVLDTAMDGISDLLCEIDEKNDEIDRLRSDNERLREALTRLVAWAGPVELACPELGGLLKAMYDARAALKERIMDDVNTELATIRYEISVALEEYDAGEADAIERLRKWINR